MSKGYAPTTNGMKNRYIWWEELHKSKPRWKGEAEAAEQFYRWFAEEIRKAKEEAWNEGYKQCFEDRPNHFGVSGTYSISTNPYEKGD